MNDIHMTTNQIPWQESWEKTFQEEKKIICSAIESAGLKAVVHHVGSTSVKDMSSKPIIDILLCPQAGTPLEAYLTILKQIGYVNLGECGRHGRYFLSKGAEENKTFYLHLCHEYHQVAQDQLLFQQIERDHTGIQFDYTRLKTVLAEIYPNDRNTYSDVKGWYIHSVLSAYCLGASNALDKYIQELNAEEDKRIKYWIYEFDMSDEKQMEIEAVCTACELTFSEFVETALEDAIQRAKIDPDNLRKDIEESAQDSEIKLVRYYPVYKGETEAQALKRTLLQEAEEAEEAEELRSEES